MNALSKVYVTNMFSRAVSLIKSKKDDYRFKWRAHYENKFALNDQNYPKVRGQWYKAPGPKRDYNIL